MLEHFTIDSGLASLHLHELGHMQVIFARSLHNTNKNEVLTFVHGPLYNEQTGKLHFM